MPLPIRTRGFSSHRPPKTLLHRPELATLIGAIVGEWGRIDASLADIFNLTSYAEAQQSGTIRMDRMAAAIFDRVVSYTAKMEIIETAMAIRFPAFSEDFVSIKRKIRPLSQERGRIDHACWSLSDAFPNDLIAYDADDTPVRYTQTCLKRL